MPNNDILDWQNCSRFIQPQSLLEVDLPSSGRVNLLHQPDKNRYVAHLLSATPHYRGGLELIEDLVTMRNVPVTLRVSENIKSVRLMPDNRAVEFHRDGDSVQVLVPEFTMHCALVFDY